MRFACLEMKVIITRLLQRYRLELIDPDPHPPPEGEMAAEPPAGCAIRRWPRTP
jgi:cytochrome P450